MKIRRVVAVIICLVFMLNSVLIYAKNTGNNNKSSGTYELKINTNNKGAVSLEEGDYAEGELLEFTVIPEDGYEVKDIKSPRVEIVELNENKYSFIMPSSKMIITVI